MCLIETFENFKPWRVVIIVCQIWWGVKADEAIIEYAKSFFANSDSAPNEIILAETYARALELAQEGKRYTFVFLSKEMSETAFQLHYCWPRVEVYVFHRFEVTEYFPAKLAKALVN